MRDAVRVGRRALGRDADHHGPGRASGNSCPRGNLCGDGANAGRKIEGSRVILVLCAPQSREGDPLWFVDVVFATPAGGQPVPPQKVAVNANTGEIEKNLLEVF